MIVTLGAAPAPRSIALSTAAGRHIPNYQISEISHFERSQFAELDRQLTATRQSRCDATALYNCHGMTFGSRRTGIYETEALQSILADDRYSELAQANVLPGDVLLYMSEAGDIEHSAVVIEAPTRERFGIPKVVSKWGKYRELVHWANDCPYDFGAVKYFRMLHV